MLIHLAQFALRVEFVSAVYQQVIHNQSTARANAEPVFNNDRRRHKPPSFKRLRDFKHIPSINSTQIYVPPVFFLVCRQVETVS